MGRREVRVVVVRKPVSLALLVVVSAALASLLYYLSGRAYVNETHPVVRVLSGVMQGGRPISTDALLANLAPAIADFLLFVPWGFLLFVTLDRPATPRLRTYAMTFLAGLAFAAALSVWQAFLPTRVTGWADAIANGLGALGGAVVGHLRKQVRVLFDY